MMNRHFAFKPLVAALLCVAWHGDSAVLVGQEEKKTAPDISIQEKWDAAIPMRDVGRKGVVSSDGRYYLRSGVWLDLRTEKILGKRNHGYDGFFTKKNHPIVVQFDSKGSRTLSLWDLKANSWALAPWKAESWIEDVAIVSEQYLLLRISPDSSDDVALLVLDIPQQKIVAHIPYPMKLGGNHFVVSADGKRIAVMLLNEGKAQVWRVSDGKLLSEIKAPWADLTPRDRVLFSHLPSDLATSPDLKYMAYTAPDITMPDNISDYLKFKPRPISVIELSTGKRVQQITGPSETVSLQFCNHNKWLFSRSGVVQLWDIGTAKNFVAPVVKKEGLPAYMKGLHEARFFVDTLLSIRLGKVSEVRLGAISPDNKYIAVLDEGPLFQNKPELQIYLMSVPNFRIVSKINVSGDLPHTLQFSPDGKYLIGDCNLRSIIWEISIQN